MKRDKPKDFPSTGLVSTYKDKENEDYSYLNRRHNEYSFLGGEIYWGEITVYPDALYTIMIKTYVL